MANSPLLVSAPIQTAMVTAKGFAEKAWVFFFNSIVDGDQGTDWTPTATGFTGTNTYTGKYFRNSGFIDFWIIVDTSTTAGSTLGSSYFELPFDVSQASACDAVYGSTVGQGIIDPSTNRCFPPSFSSVVPVTITARVFTK